MRNFKSTILTGVLFIYVNISFSQTFIDQIKVGDLMPTNIDKGGYSEKENPDCSCRIFFITHNTENSKMGDKATTVGIHYQNDTVVGIIKINIRVSESDALLVYISRMSYLINTLKSKYYANREIIKARDSKNGTIDGIYYFGYSDDNGNTRKMTGVINNTIIEEIYKVDSNYNWKLKD
jgi:hypothetical protein